MNTYRYGKSSFMTWMALAFFVATPSFAQITITHESWPTRLQTSTTAVTYSTFEGNAALTALAANTGANKTWDFTGITFNEVDSLTIENVSVPVEGVDDDHLGMATHAWRYGGTSLSGLDSTVYSFFVVSEDSISMLGSYARADIDDDGAVDEIIIRFLPGLKDIPLPLTSTTAPWSTSYTMETEFNGETMPFLNTSIRDESEVVGWGTLVLPEGSAGALMIRSMTISTTEIPGLPASTDTSYSVQFMTESWLGASIGLDENGEADFASYSILRDPGTASEPDPAIPDQITLDQNYPNPFNPSTSIDFELKQSGQVTLKVYDVLGKEVATLVNGVQAAGEHTVTFSAAGLPSGIYTYRLESSGQVVNRTMTLVK